MKILVTNTYFYFLDKKQWKTKRPYPPLGSLYAVSVLREMGHEVELFDNCLKKSTSPFKKKLENYSPDLLVVYDDGFNYLTKMCLTNMRHAAMDMGQKSKELGIDCLISSSDSTDHADIYLNSGYKFVILGEGEEILKSIVQNLENNSGTESLEGVSFKKDKEIISNPRREIIRDLDNIPDAAWDAIDILPYREMWLKNHDYFSLNINTTRGCPFKCNWCAKPIYGNRYNSRSPERVVNEMAFLQDKFGVDEFWVTDDIFGLKPGWVQEFNDIIQDMGRHFKYKIQSRADLMLKDHNLEAMVESGMSEVWIGAESGSQKILDAMDKEITVEQIREVTKKVQEKGRKICFFLQFGYLEESEEDIQKTVDLLLEMMPDDIGISVSYPLPGTGFYNKVKSQLITKANWTDSDDLDVMYEATFDKSFYKRLHRKVHKLYRRRQGILMLKNSLQKFPDMRNFPWKAATLSLFYYTPSLLINRLIKG